MNLMKSIALLFLALLLCLPGSGLLQAEENTETQQVEENTEASQAEENTETQQSAEEITQAAQAEERLICNLPRSDLGGEKNWTLEKDKKGIKVYLRKTSKSPVRIFRGVSVFDVKFNELVALIWDGERYVDWLLLCDEAKLLEVVSDTEQYLYTANKPVFPVKKRDSVCHRQIFQDPETLAVTVEMCLADGYIPEKKGNVRIPLLFGYGKIVPVSEGKTKLIYEVLVDVGGWVPKWVIDFYQADIAYITFRNLVKKMIPLDKYSDVYYDFIKYPNYQNKLANAHIQEKPSTPTVEQEDTPLPAADMGDENSHK